MNSCQILPTKAGWRRIKLPPHTVPSIQIFTFVWLRCLIQTFFYVSWRTFYFPYSFKIKISIALLFSAPIILSTWDRYTGFVGSFLRFRRTLTSPTLSRLKFRLLYFSRHPLFYPRGINILVMLALFLRFQRTLDFTKTNYLIVGFGDTPDSSPLFSQLNRSLTVLNKLPFTYYLSTYLGHSWDCAINRFY